MTQPGHRGRADGSHDPSFSKDARTVREDARTHQLLRRPDHGAYGLASPFVIVTVGARGYCHVLSWMLRDGLWRDARGRVQAPDLVRNQLLQAPQIAITDAELVQLPDGMEKVGGA